MPLPLVLNGNMETEVWVKEKSIALLWNSLVAQWVKDPALLLLWLRSPLWWSSIPGLETSLCDGCGKKKKKRLALLLCQAKEATAG